jgi:hypothetical protein
MYDLFDVTNSAFCTDTSLIDLQCQIKQSMRLQHHVTTIK